MSRYALRSHGAVVAHSPPSTETASAADSQSSAFASLADTSNDTQGLETELPQPFNHAGPPPLFRKRSNRDIEGLQNGSYRLPIGIDFGVRDSCIEYSMVSNTGAITEKTRITSHIVRFGDDEKRIPMELGFVYEATSRDPRVVWDKELANCLRKRTVWQADVLDFPKLSLLEGHQDEVFKSISDQTARETAYRLWQSVQASHTRALQKWLGKIVRVVLHHSEEVMQITIRKAQDLIKIWFALLVDRLKMSIFEHIGGSKQEVSAILADTIVQIAVPETWCDEMIDLLQDLSTQEFGLSKVRIVSESECSALAVLYKDIESIRAESAEVPAVTEARLRDLQDTIYVVADHGAGTVDISSKVVESLGHKLVLKTAAKSVSMLQGAQNLNELFVDRLPEVFGQKYQTILDACDDRQALNDGFRRGVEQAKRELDPTGDESIPVRCDTLQALLEFSDGHQQHFNTVNVPVQIFRDIFDKHLELVFKTIDSHLRELKAYTNLHPGKSVKLVNVGGANRSSYIRTKLVEHYRDWGMTIVFRDHPSSLVAYGAMLAALDFDLGVPEHARTSYGTVLSVEFDETNQKHTNWEAHKTATPDGYPYPYELHNRAFWGIKMGNILSYHQVINGTITKYFEHRKRDQWPLVLKQELIKTRNPYLGLDDDIDAKQDTILPAGQLHMKIKKDQNSFDIFIDSKRKKYVCVQYRGIPIWDGMRAKWHFVIHKSGWFPEDHATDEYLRKPDEYLVEEMTLRDVMMYAAVRR